MRTCGMLKKEINPFLLQQTHHEIGIGFTRLHAIAAGWIALRGAVFKPRNAVIGKHLLDDVERVEFLKYFPIGGGGEDDPLVDQA